MSMIATADSSLQAAKPLTSANHPGCAPAISGSGRVGPELWALIDLLAPGLLRLARPCQCPERELRLIQGARSLKGGRLGRRSLAGPPPVATALARRRRALGRCASANRGRGCHLGERGWR